MRIPYNQIIIDIQLNKNKPSLSVKSMPLNNDDQWSYSKIDTSFTISSDEFNKLTSTIEKMLDSGLGINDTVSGKDGSEWLLQFEYKGVTKVYKAWSPDYDTKNRELNNFMENCRLIVETAKLKPILIRE